MWAAIGVDVGGGGVRAALVRDQRVGPVSRLALSDRTVTTVIAAVVALVEGLDPAGTLPVGVGVPGFIRDGLILESPNFPSWRNVPLYRQLASRLGRVVAVENDANAAALGAWDGINDLVLLTLGTGVGGGVISGGRLIRGAGGTGAELGHLWAGGDRLCGCGGSGCLETWISTGGLVRGASEVGQKATTGQAVVEAADRGEAWAVAICRQAAMALGRGVATLVNLFNPDQLVISGGLAHARHRFEEGVHEGLGRAVRPSAEWVTVKWVPDADRFAIPGAAAAVISVRQE